MTTTASVSPTTGEQLKRDGQAQSLTRTTPDHHEAFMAPIRALAPGQAFTANTLRHHWDAAGIPTSARGGLMNAACALGLAEPVRFDVAGEQAAVKVASTGPTAHRAYVCLYRRPVVHPEGR